MKVSRVRKSVVGKVGASVLALVGALGACDSTEEQLRALELGGHCSLDSECKGDLVCVFERCHVECDEDKDCKDSGGRCVRVPQEDMEESTTVGVCQLPTESECELDDDCKGKQVCAPDLQCRDLCSISSNSCFPGFACAVSGQCALDAELNAKGELGPAKDPGAAGIGGEGARSGAGGSGGIGMGDGGAQIMGGAGGAPDLGGAGGGGSSTGGRSAGGDTSVGGASGGAGDDAASGAGGGPDGSLFDYFETSDGIETVDNNDRDHTLPAKSTASLYLAKDDEDWFSLQAPNDGRAHVITVDIKQTPGLLTEVHALAAADFSEIGSGAVLSSGVTSAVHLSVGPGSTTLLRLRVYANGTAGRAELAFTMTPENDANEPNNDCASAKEISLGTEVTAQFVVPYISATDQATDDWYKLHLDPVASTLTWLSGPTNGRFKISRVNSSGVTASMTTTVENEYPPIPFTPAAAGIFCIHFASYAGTFPEFAKGAMPSNMSTPYVFRIDQ